MVESHFLLKTEKCGLISPNVCSAVIFLLKGWKHHQHAETVVDTRQCGAVH